jgi:hypothetical protein
VRQRQRNRGNILNSLIAMLVVAQFRYGTWCWPSTQANVGWPSVALGPWERCACLVNRHIRKEVEIDGKTPFDLLSKVTP